MQGGILFHNTLMEPSTKEYQAYECSLTTPCAESGAVIRRSPQSRAIRVTRGIIDTTKVPKELTYIPE